MLVVSALLDMLTRFPTGLLISSLVLAASALPVESAVQLTVLTPENFDTTVAKGAWFIEHFSPYCHHCRQFAPTWEKLVEHYESDSGVHLAQVNCAVNGDLCNQHGVTGYPQMMMYVDGEVVEKFKDRREMDVLTEFIDKHAIHEKKPPNEEGIVRPVDAKGFKALLAEGPAFVKFYAPWCGHCKKLAPIFTQLGAVMKNKINIVEVNCEAHGDLCKAQDVKGYPTLTYYTGGADANMHKTEYTGGRRLDQMQNFLEMAIAPPVRSVKSQDDYELYVAESSVLYVFLHGDDDKSALELLHRASTVLLGSPTILTSTDSDMRRRFNLPSVHASSPVILSVKDGNAYTYSSSFVLPSGNGNSKESLSALSDWLLRNRLPTALSLTQDTFQEVMNAPHRPLVVVAAYPPAQEAQASEVMRSAAAAWKHHVSEHQKLGARDVVFTWMDADRWAKWVKSMYGIKSPDLPAVVVTDHQKLIYYDTNEQGSKIPFAGPGIIAAVDSIVEGKVSYKNSENIMERMARSLNNYLQQLEEGVLSHPYRAGLMFIGFLAALTYAILRFVGDEMPSSQAESARLQKGGNRID